jgi:hypothetical protein
MIAAKILNELTVPIACRPPLPVIKVNHVQHWRRRLLFSFAERIDVDISPSKAPDVPHHEVEERHRIAPPAHSEQVDCSAWRLRL